MADILAPSWDLATWLGTDPGVDATQLALEIATGWVQGYTGQKLVPVTNETITLPLHGPSGTVWLPQRPVTAVGTVLTTDRAGTNTTRTLHVDYALVGQKLKWLYPLPWTAVTVTVTYSHGYAEAPQDVRGVVLAAAARRIENPRGLRSETVGAVSWTAGGASADAVVGLTEEEKAALTAYRLPLVF